MATETNIFIDMRPFVRSVAIITVFAVLTRALGFLFRIFLARILGDEMLGVYQIAMTFFMVFLTLVASGLPLSISKQVATNKTQGVIVAGLVISLTVSVVACLFVWLGSALFAPLFTDRRCIAILITLVPSLIAASVYGVVRAFWWGEKRYFLLGITELMEQILRVGVFIAMLAFTFVLTDMAKVAALSYTVAVFIAAAVCAVIFVRARRIPQTVVRDNQYKSLLKSATPITSVRVLTSLTMPIVTILITNRLIATGGWDTAAVVAAFGVLVGMTLPLLSIPQTVISSLSTALVPELSSAHNEQKREAVGNQISTALKFTLFITFALVPIYMAIGQGIGVFVFDNVSAGVYLAQFAWAMIPMSLALLTNAILNSLNAETRAMKNYMVGAVFLFLCVWFMPQYVGMGAIVLGMGGCMAIASILNLCLISRLAGIEAVKSVVGVCCAFVCIAVPCAIWGWFLWGVLGHILGIFGALLVCGGAILGAFLYLCHVFELVHIDTIRVAIRRRD